LLVGQLVEGIACRSDTTQTYTLYLPSCYDPDSEWPALLVFDPRGRSLHAATLFRDAAESYGWIVVSSNDTRSDGPWEPNARALRALWPEVHGRYAIDAERIYAAGFSGGVLVAWYLAQFAEPPSLAGIIGAGGRPAPEIPDETILFAHFGTAGHLDFNYSAMKELDAIVDNSGAPHQFRVFEGRHQWLPPELATEAVEWMEVLAMQEQLREPDPDLLEALFRESLDRAVALEAAGEKLDALRRYETIEQAWGGLVQIAPVPERISALRDDATVREQRDEEQRAERFEIETMDQLLQPLRELEEGRLAGSWEEYVEELGIRDLQTQSAAGGDAGHAAQRVLEWIFARTSFYMMRQHYALERFSEAATVLRIAAEIRPGAARVWYNLACARARSGEESGAVEALVRAIDSGFDDLASIENDSDLDAIRSASGYEDAVARLRSR
jgi:predicted esterase